VVGLSANAIANGYAVGAALLALWLFLRYPQVGARTIRGAVLVVACAYGSLLWTGAATAAAQSVAGPVVALLGVYLPLLTFAFWSGFRLLHVAFASASRFGA
jgi:uncharacterized membrane protein